LINIEYIFVCFSDNPHKCCKYARQHKHDKYLLRCKVIMGDIKVSINADLV